MAVQDEALCIWTKSDGNFGMSGELLHQKAEVWKSMWPELTNKSMKSAVHFPLKHPGQGFRKGVGAISTHLSK